MHLERPIVEVTQALPCGGKAAHLCCVCIAGWTGKIEVEAYVVTIKNAAGADDAGLLNPLLKRWQDQACSQMVFGLPAVQSVINFKWDRYGNMIPLLCCPTQVCPWGPCAEGGRHGA